MKRLLFIIPFVLLFLLNACGNDPPKTGLSATELAAAIDTLTAMAWTITPTPTVNPNIATMVNWLNGDLLITNSLGSTIDADYSVNKMAFLNIPNSSNLTLQIDVGCTCMNDTKCCTPERTFVVIIDSMRSHFANSGLIPQAVSQILIVSFDQKTQSQLGAVLAPWRDVQGYLLQQVSGNQLGVEVTLTTAPTISPQY